MYIFGVYSNCFGVFPLFLISVLGFVCCFAVPSSAPYGIRVTSVPFSSDIFVYWNPLSQSYANGKILGYTVHYSHNQGSYYWSLDKSINTSGANNTQLTLTNLKAGQQYRVAVAAFTSKGVGPMSYWLYVTTGELSGGK